MLNYIWLSFLLIAAAVAGFTGRLDAMTKGAFETAETAVMKIALPLAGLMALWLGMMRLAERAGLVDLMARALRPLLRRIFPEVPPEHPAMGAIVMNMAANMLGLNNAATPLGLRAMALLQQLNPRPATASNAMCTFLAINTASIQLVPTTAISILAVAGAAAPSAFVPAAILSTGFALIVGILSARFFQRLPFFAIKAEDELQSAEAPGTASAPTELTTVEQIRPGELTRGRRAALAAYFSILALLAFVLLCPGQASAFARQCGAAWQYADPFPASPWGTGFGFRDLFSSFLRIVRVASLLAVPFLLTFLPFYAMLRRVKVYEQFTEGAKDAFGTATRIIPFLVAMLVSIRMLREAGVIDSVTAALQPMLGKLGFPSELLPLVLLRPLSGSASQGIFVDLVNTHGPDSFIAHAAATIYGSTETTFYVLAVYFGSVSIRRTRHALACGLVADATAMVLAIFFCRLFQ